MRQVLTHLSHGVPEVELVKAVTFLKKVVSRGVTFEVKNSW